MSLATLFVQQLDSDNWAVQINGLKNEETWIFTNKKFAKENGYGDPVGVLSPPLFQRIRSVFSSTIRAVVPPMDKITEYINLFYALGYKILGTSSHGSHPASQTFMWTFQHIPLAKQLSTENEIKAQLRRQESIVPLT